MEVFLYKHGLFENKQMHAKSNSASKNEIGRTLTNNFISENIFKYKINFA